ncbi:MULTISPECIES: DsbA family protein [Erythrobacter]|uniref:DsbA family protein n=1 Tax=Erythrobacter aureus TaxID=2182384 RepID=A0A345YBI5_9SPHN|nr:MULTISPECIES: DsbA family protein [Erythrobacter]AXK41287.1 DsbA family protein [Erythrobacter aureus]MCF8882948.1 DsbA family protein [Erythrobacter sp. SN021]
MRNHLLTALIALVFGFAGAALWSLSGLGNGQTRDYLLANPQILPEMAEAYQRGDAQNRLAQIADEVKQPFPGAVLGNPDGSKVLVKFTDYGCTYCRQSVAAIDELIATDPELKVVVREWPIFDGSEQAARMALAAAKQGKYPAFYHAMFEQGPPSEGTIARAAQIAGLDIAAAEVFAQSDEATAELAKTMAFARTLQFTGTPSWVAGGEVIEGLVPAERLAKALDAET